jgi:hypothetical protein
MTPGLAHLPITVQLVNSGGMLGERLQLDPAEREWEPQSAA